jgi:hypothetical protein
MKFLEFCVDLSWNVASVLVRFSPFPSLSLALETRYLLKVRKSIFLGFNSSKKPTVVFLISALAFEIGQIKKYRHLLF